MSVNSLHKILNKIPCNPLVANRTGNPLPNNASTPSDEMISLAAATMIGLAARTSSCQEIGLTVANIFLVYLSIGLYYSERITDGI